MKAAVLVEQNAPLEILDVDLTKLVAGQVLVRVDYSGICGKQIDEITGRQGEDAYFPHLLGHEGSGVVADVGPSVTKVCAHLDAAVREYLARLLDEAERLTDDDEK